MVIVRLFAPVLVNPPDLNSGSFAAVKFGCGLVAKKGIVWLSDGASGQSGLPIPSLLLRYVPVGSQAVSAVWVPHRRKNTLTPVAAPAEPCDPFSRTRAIAKL